MKSSVLCSLSVSSIILMLLFTSVILIASDGPRQGDMVPTYRPGRGDYTPTNEWIEVTHPLAYSNPLSISVSSVYDVREITIDMVTFTADELRDNSGGNPDSPVISTLQSEISSNVKEAFGKYSEGIKVSEPVMGVDEADLGLTYVDSDPYNPPITVTATVQLTLGKLSFFTQQEDTYYNVVNLQDLLEGCLLMGGLIYSDVAFFSYMGHNTTYRIASEFNLYGLADAKQPRGFSGHAGRRRAHHGNRYPALAQAVGDLTGALRRGVVEHAVAVALSRIVAFGGVLHQQQVAAGDQVRGEGSGGPLADSGGVGTRHRGDAQTQQQAQHRRYADCRRWKRVMWSPHG